MYEPPTDREVLAILAAYNFQGPKWDRFANELAAYGITIMRSWITSGKIFAELHARQIRHSAGNDRRGQLTPLDVTDIAVEATARAIVSFRDKMLLNGRWSPDGGASLKTSFITQCLFQFPNAERWWRRERGVSSEPPGDEKVLDLTSKELGPDPARTLIDRERQIELIADLPGDLTKAAIQLMTEGYSAREAAEFLGVKPKKIDNALNRYRQKKRRQDEEDGMAS